MKVLNSFMKKNKPAKRKSVMKSYRDEILKLFDEDYSVNQIQDFLKLCGVETSIGNIYYFIKTQKKSKGGKNFSLQTNEENSGDNNDTEVQNEDEEVTLTSMRRILKARENKNNEEN